MFKVNRGVTIPHMSRGGGSRKYPFDQLEIGDMFFVPGKEKNTLSTHTSTISKKLGFRFVTRLVWMVGSDEEGWGTASKGDEGAVQGIGVWRVEPKEAAAEASEETGEPAPEASDEGEAELGEPETEPVAKRRRRG